VIRLLLLFGALYWAWGWGSAILMTIFLVMQGIVWCGEHPLPVEEPYYIAPGNEFPMLPIAPEIRFEPRYPDMPQAWNWAVHLYLLDEISLYELVERDPYGRTAPPLR